MSEVEKKLERMGITLPDLTAPVAAYVPFVVANGLVFISGQLPMKEGKLAAKGIVGLDVSLDEAQAAARQCAINAMAALKFAADGNIDRIVRIVKLEGYVASAPSFTDQHLVVNGASELFVKAFGEAGKHSRIAVGTTSLPLGAAVELGVIAMLSKYDKI